MPPFFDGQANPSDAFTNTAKMLPKPQNRQRSHDSRKYEAGLSLGVQRYQLHNYDSGSFYVKAAAAASQI